MIRSIFLPLALVLVLTACSHAPSPPADRAPALASTSGQPAFYPTALLAQRKEGRAGIYCAIAVDGTPRNCQVTGADGDPGFAAAALDYVSQSRFLPALRGGVPVEAPWHSIISFALERNYSPAQFRDLLLPIKVAGSTLVFPPRMQQAGREGTADVSCRITADGFTKDCTLIEGFGGSAFAEAALDYVTHLRYAPALRHGVPIEMRRAIDVDFRFHDSHFPRGIPDVMPDGSNHGIVTPVSEQTIAGPPLAFPDKLLAAGREGFVDVRCFVTIYGTTYGCRVIDSTGDQDFEAAALEALAHARFKPATANGQPVEATHKWKMTYRAP